MTSKIEDGTQNIMCILYKLNNCSKILTYEFILKLLIFLLTNDN
jgi:hypothetical protein